jgi:hypothetical protein
MQPPRDAAVTTRRQQTQLPPPPLPQAECAPLDGAALADEALNLAERVAARMGAWMGMLALRFAPPMGPFFAADGRHAYDGSLYLLDSPPPETTLS